MSGTGNFAGTSVEPADRHRTLRMKFISLISAMIKVPAEPRRGPLKSEDAAKKVGHLHSTGGPPAFGIWGAVKDAISGKSRNCPQGSERTEKTRIFGLLRTRFYECFLTSTKSGKRSSSWKVGECVCVCGSQFRPK